jgi:hypothetical protein
VVGGRGTCGREVSPSPVALARGGVAGLLTGAEGGPFGGRPLFRRRLLLSGILPTMLRLERRDTPMDERRSGLSVGDAGAPAGEAQGGEAQSC